MSTEEQEYFTNSVNSPLKAPNQGGGPREGQHRDISGARKLSFSQGPGSGNVASPIGTRPFGRRRDTNESYPFPKESIASPSTAKLSRDDPLSGPPNPLVRRRTDLKDMSSDRASGDNNRDDEEAASGPFGLTRRVTSGPLSAGIGAPPSPWSTSGFGSFSSANGPASIQKRPSALSRSESRFKNLMNRENTDAMGDPGLDRSRHGLGKLSEDKSRAYTSRHSSKDDEGRQSGEVEGIYGNDRPVGSAALGGAHDDIVPEQHRLSNLGPSQSQLATEQSTAGFPKNEDNPLLDHHNHFPQRLQHGDEPSSPTFTNPYQSPDRNMSKLNDYEGDELDVSNLHLPGLGGPRGGDFGPAGLPSNPGIRGSAAFDPQSFERSQGFPTAPQRGFSGLGGLGTLPALGTPGQWPTALASGTPSRERAFQGFGDLMGLHEEMHGQAFPGLGGLGSYGMEHSPNDAHRAFGGSRLGSLFPSAMQDQMRPSESMSVRERSGEGYDPFAPRAPGSNNLAGPTRDAESPFGMNQARFNESASRDEKFSDSSADAHASLHQRYSPGPLTQGAPSHPSLDQMQRRRSSDQDQAQSQSLQPPAAQQKTMVMPDRIRWIYRDPQGNTQGPWSGLEMHDWYRAGFFSPELLVKKVEDPDYEPLAQLIRRIGNSREPFLVPQIGIPGPPSTSGSWPTQPTATAPPVVTNAPSAQPPFASSFPSFGTTLTAEQQNALERRKQEEQYLMARQKEHLAQQQVLAKQRQMHGPSTHGVHNVQQQQQQQQQTAPPLHHHSSAHSLQSQPSYGSMTTPSYQGIAVSGTNRQATGVFEAGYRGGPSAGTIGSNVESVGLGKSEDSSRTIDRLSLGHPGPTAFDGTRQVREQHDLTEQDLEDERIATMLEDRARLEFEQAETENAFSRIQSTLGTGEQRLQEFHDLRKAQNFQAHDQEGLQRSKEPSTPEGTQAKLANADAMERFGEPQGHKLTLTEQVQKAASAKQSPAASASQSPWASKVDKPIAESHPSSQTSSPLPAPAARRSGRQSVADALAAESSKPTSPVAETPSMSVAPWAREPADTMKQPSLKEIQEAEAQRAAKRDEEQAALRRAALERELANQPTAPAPGLPSSSTWASGEAITSPTASAPSAWTKVTTKPTIASAGKKTLSQIQKEEEALAKKQKAAAAAATAAHGNTASAIANTAQAISAGKRYADLASRAAAPATGAASAWTTVGAGGKPKTPAAVPTPPTLQRTATGNIVTSPPATTVKKPVAGLNRTNSSSAVLTAHDEFKKWAVGELRPDLNKGVNRKYLEFCYL